MRFPQMHLQYDIQCRYKYLYKHTHCLGWPEVFGLVWFGLYEKNYDNLLNINTLDLRLFMQANNDSTRTLDSIQ